MPPWPHHRERCPCESSGLKGQSMRPPWLATPSGLLSTWDLLQWVAGICHHTGHHAGTVQDTGGPIYQSSLSLGASYASHLMPSPGSWRTEPPPSQVLEPPKSCPDVTHLLQGPPHLFCGVWSQVHFLRGHPGHQRHQPGAKVLRHG